MRMLGIDRGQDRRVLSILYSVMHCVKLEPGIKIENQG